MKLVRVCLAICAAALSLLAFADPAVPSFQSGQFVYRSPAGYKPPRINQPLLDALQLKASSAHYPFYIVLMDRVSDDQAASRLGNGILRDWSRSPDFDSQRSSLFLVTFEGDRKYRLFSAPEWRSKLGLEITDRNDNLEQFTSIFLKSAKSGDPFEGIVKLMDSYDSYVFDRTDPARIAEIAALRAERQLRLLQGMGLLAVLACFVAAVFLAVRRRAAYAREKAGFAARVESWRAKISGARLRYYDKIYNQENEFVSQKLKEYSAESETGKLYQSVAQETDDIISQVEALALHVDECEKRAKSATAFRSGPLRQAAAELDEPFAFDTGQISSKLLDPINSVIQVDPHIEVESLNVRFDQVLQSWDRLKRALINATIPPSELFKHSDLDAMISRAKEKGIPLRWLKKHPLFGGDEEDRALYRALDAPRSTDPILYCIEVEKNMAVQAKLEDDLRRLIEAVDLAVSEVVTEISGLEDTKLGPDDDPKLTLDRARQNQDRLAGLLESSDSVEEVEAQARKVYELYQTCELQLGEAKSAIAFAHEEADKAAAALPDLEKEESKASQAIERAAQIHAHTEPARQALEAGHSYLVAAKSSLDSARKELENKAHLLALRQATLATHQLDQCKDRFDAVYRSIADLDKAKAQFELKLHQMDGLYESAVGSVRLYNGSADNLAQFKRPEVGDGPADYALLAGMLAAQEQDWDTEVLRAKQSYDLEIARQQAEERRRQESASSSSWSGGSDSGGSWSSGGGDSGGSWSSGGGDSGGSW